MATFVLSFRSAKERAPDAGEEAAWGDWFKTIGASISDPGNRVGRSSPLGNCGPDTALSGYTIVSAEDLEAAVSLAKGCPGLEHGGGVEVGAIVDM
jgi:hypothetical protein